MDIVSVGFDYFSYFSICKLGLGKEENVFTRSQGESGKTGKF